MRIPSFQNARLSLVALAAACAVGTSVASSHREAPFIATSPKVDATDFYMFRSYENVAADGTGGRSDFVTLIANYQPLQDPYGGPNYFSLDPNALYEIHVDNNGDAAEDLTFQFRFNNKLNNISLPVGGKSVAIPIIQKGGVANLNDGNLNLTETYTLTVVRGDRRKGTAGPVTKAAGGSTFEKPVDYIGTKTLGDQAAYAAYASRHIHNIRIPGCSVDGKVFVGQRQEGFAVNLGPIFDLVNLNPTGPANAAVTNSIQDKNVTTLALEVHKSCLTAGGGAVLGGWTTASLRQVRLIDGKPGSGHQVGEKVGGAWAQVSRLGQPLVNEVVIGLKDKDKFNASRPADDLQFLDYVTNPTLPALLNVALNVPPPTNFPRTDLVSVFLAGIDGTNRPAGVKPAEVLRLNTALPPVPFDGQNRLGIVGNALAGGTDRAGFPNGRRPKDDVVDIALIAMVGGLCVANGNNNAFKFNSVAGLTSNCNPDAAPLGNTTFSVNDGVDQAVVPFLPGFPYLNTPNPGAQ